MDHCEFELVSGFGFRISDLGDRLPVVLFISARLIPEEPAPFIIPRRPRPPGRGLFHFCGRVVVRDGAGLFRAKDAEGDDRRLRR